MGRGMRIGIRMTALLAFAIGVPLLATAEEAPVTIVTGRPATMDRMTVFVGEKLAVERFTPDLAPNEMLLDAAFHAKYRVLQTVQSDDPGEVIEFTVYDHYGEPAFGRFQHVLLFVNRTDDGYFHAKYQFYPVFLTRGGMWAGCGPVGKYDAEQRRGIATAKPMDFGPDAYFPLDSEKTPAENRRDYPPQHFRIEGARAYCLTGSRLQELIEIKRRTVFQDAGRD